MNHAHLLDGGQSCSSNRIATSTLTSHGSPTLIRASLSCRPPTLPPATIAILRSLLRAGSATTIGHSDPPAPLIVDEFAADYTPGANRRLIDWVRSERTTILCQYDDCESDVQVRLTDVGPICMEHYLYRPTCKVPGCHRPQADPRTGKRYIGIYHCWFHDYDSEATEIGEAWWRWMRDRRAPFALDAC